MTVCSRWAMAMSVQPRNSSRIVFWISASVSTSTLAVASSRTNTLADFSRARASATSCFCPILKGEPPSRSCMSRPSGLRDTTSCRCARCTACHTSSSLYSPKGSRLKRRVPVKRAGTWGIMASAPRSWCRPSWLMSTPSTRMTPASSSIRRNSVLIRDDLPAPVRPTTPTLLPAATLMSSPRNTSGRPARYRIFTPSYSTLPAVGQPGGQAPSISSGASLLMAQYSSTRSTELKETSAMEASRTVMATAEEMERA
mmetsp:Transcript_2948/g.7319  ORF Transcript_2948/g.7319 Transcript_2948/m.7319 type:complete len:256 (-) Transcript_2948:432-1199(-)